MLLSTDVNTSDEWLASLLTVINLRNKINKAFAKNLTHNRINQAINKQCAIIQTNIKKWTSSILDKQSNHIIIDKASHIDEEMHRHLLKSTL